MGCCTNYKIIEIQTMRYTPAFICILPASWNHVWNQLNIFFPFYMRLMSKKSDKNLFRLLSFIIVYTYIIDSVRVRVRIKLEMSTESSAFRVKIFSIFEWFHLAKWIVVSIKIERTKKWKNDFYAQKRKALERLWDPQSLWGHYWVGQCVKEAWEINDSQFCLNIRHCYIISDFHFYEFYKNKTR